MPRLPRLHVPGSFYHVTLRGNHRENIFSTPDDRLKLNAIVAEAIEKYSAQIHAFCWMSNHLHALIRIHEVRLGKIVQRIAMRYSRYRHKQLRTTGHLFERRYGARLVDADAYFITALRYIHLNPVDARIVASPDDYPWSSHHAYAGTESIPWVTIDFGLSLLGRTYGGARDAYRRLVNGEITSNEHIASRLLPSSDPRVIGTDRFLASLPPPLIKPRSALTLEQLVAEVCNNFGFSTEEVRAPNRRRQFTAARALIAERAVDERIASLHQVGRYLSRSVPALCQLMQQNRKR